MENQFNKSSYKLPGIVFTNLHENMQHVVKAKNVCKSHGNLKMLENFSMNVAVGTIYSLLGSSGCGKTTALSCIVGLKSWDSGNIKVFGHEQSVSDTGDNYGQIGRRIGFMPQELSLYEHLTTEEIVRYFGKLYGMMENDIENKWKVLAKLLGFSTKYFTNSKQICNLSGGQKRRASLAVALIHNPELLVLDEPTVGLDPLLRQRIWHHLKELTVLHKTSVIITTHYIEETRFSHKVGVMRKGRLLVEDSPASLLSVYQSTFLQDAILRICKNDNIMTGQPSTEKVVKNFNDIVSQFRRKLSPKSSIELVDDMPNNIACCGFTEKNPDEMLINNLAGDNEIAKGQPLCLNNFIQSVSRTQAFATVIWIFLVRQPMFAFILLFLPAIQLIMTFYVVGKEPTNLSFGVINNEVRDFGTESCKNISFSIDGPCDLTLLGCRIENALNNTEKIDLIGLSNMDETNEMMRNGFIFGVLMIPQNYSENLVNRYITGKFADDNDTLEGSKLSLTLDKSHYLAYFLIIKEVITSLEILSTTLESSCGFDHSFNQIPLQFREPVYGRKDGTDQESIMPAIIIQILFEMFYGIAPIILIKDLKNGTFERSTLAGLKFSEFMLGLLVAMSPILIFQSMSCYIVLHFGFNIGVQGSFFLFTFLCVVAGLCGQGFGIFMGNLLQSEFTVIVSAIMVVPIVMTCSGTLWMLEAHPPFLTIIYYIFPSAMLVSSLRSVVNRGVGISHRLVWPGIVNSVSWSVVFWLLSIFIFKRMSNR